MRVTFFSVGARSHAGQVAAFLVPAGPIVHGSFLSMHGMRFGSRVFGGRLRTPATTCFDVVSGTTELCVKIFGNDRITHFKSDGRLHTFRLSWM
jgi:hypothetical protein